MADLDPVRARLLARHAVPVGGRALVDLSGVGDDAPAGLARLWEQVGYQVRERYQTLQQWLATYAAGEPTALDAFLTLLFGDVLSRPGFGFYNDTAGARACGRLVESARKFAEAVGRADRALPGELARAYTELVLGGIASAEYLLDWPDEPPDDAIVLATAYAYVTRDLRSDVQLWLELGAEGWWNRPNQPLTHPYVLSNNWAPGQPWREIEEDVARRETLGKLVYGLAARCDTSILLGSSELGVDGVEQRGPLQRAALRALAAGGARG